MKNRIRTDLGFVREVLASHDATCGYAAAQKHGLHASTVAKWVKRRDLEGPTWPTDADVAEWRRDEEENGAARRAEAARALAYTKRVYLQRGGVKVDATGTQRRLKALMALGWTQSDIAAELGITASRVGFITNKYPRVYRQTAQAVSELYDRWSMIVPADTGPRRRGHNMRHEIARRMAARKGWLPPLAWDDIDDPDEDPKSRPVPIRPAGRQDLKPDRIEDIAWMADSNETLTSAAARLDVTVEDLWVTCKRAGRKDLYWRLAARDDNLQRRIVAERQLRMAGAA